MTSQRAGRSAGPFGLHPTAPILARLPLMAADTADSCMDGLLNEGVSLASRALEGKSAFDARSRQSTRAYELRARWRTTPHGVFAGVALAVVVNGPARLHIGNRHRARSNPSATWLVATCAKLLAEPYGPEVLQRLTLTADATAMRRGERWEVEIEPPDSSSTVQRCTVRATAATDLILAACADGAATDAVLNLVRSRWPQAPESTVLDTITNLIRHGFLLTDLLPGDLGNDPISHLLSVLPPMHPVRGPLIEMRAALAAADRHAPGHAERREGLSAARDLADRICRVERPLTVDVALDADLGVPAELLSDVIEAAGVLSRISPQRDPAAEFHRRFIDRYGHHRYVPLLEAADPVIGIGAEVPAETKPEDSGRVTVLAGLIARAASDRAIEVELDDASIATLATHATMPPHGTDVHVRLVADNADAAAQGRLRAIVAGCVPTAGSTLARFASLLDHHHNEPEAGEAVIAELAVRSRNASVQSVVPPTGFADYRIPIGVPRAGERDLKLEDLLLVSDGAHLTVWSAVLNRPVIPRFYSRLSLRLLPPIARLLYTIGHSGTSPWHTWSWDIAGVWPFKPRVRYRRTILSPACWELPHSLIDAADDAERWESELDQWRSTAIPVPPPTIVTESDDRQLPLTLDNSDDRQLLRRYVRRGLNAVTEMPGGQNSACAVATGPSGGHLVELVIPLIRNAGTVTIRHRATLPIRSRGAGLFHPGGPWLSLAIPTAPYLEDELLLCLADLVGDLTGSFDSWFWLRYNTADLGHHLRVRFHGRPEILGSHVLPAVAGWVAAMNDQRLAGRMIIECYEQEIERYGGPSAIERAEDVFAADSQLAASLLPGGLEDRIAAAAQIAAIIARTVADGDISALNGRHLDRDARQMLNQLRPRVRAADGVTTPGEPKMVAMLLKTLSAYRDVVPAHLRPACASTLIHMHANRTLPSVGDERVVRALGADLLARSR